MKKAVKLDQLTSLRFFGVLMIVIHHSTGLFGIESIGINFGQGVSFFFVLSGFILTYVYPQLNTWVEIKQFWRARIARLWPIYVATFLLGFWLIPYRWDTKTAIANLFMIQAWIPMSTFYFSYNAVSWAASTLFFFYLAFPFIIYKWDEQWLIKLIVSITILMTLITLLNLYSLPDYGNRMIGLNGLLITQHGLLYINPLSRIFEFVFGMCIALAFVRTQGLAPSQLMATGFEIGVIVLCAISMYYTNFMVSWSIKTVLGPSIGQWLVHSASFLAFGLLIYVMALGRGVISKILSNQFFVFLGDISFSLFLIHQILLNIYRKEISGLAHLSNPFSFLIFFCVLLLTSYLLYQCVEMPARRLIQGDQKIHDTKIMKQSWRNNLLQSRKPLMAGFVLVCIFGYLYYTMGANYFISSRSSITTPEVESQTVKYFVDKSDVREKGISAYRYISGWVYVADQQTKGQEVYVQFVKPDGTVVHYSTMTVARPDVGAYFKNSLYDASGFIALIPLKDGSDINSCTIMFVVKNKKGIYKSPIWQAGRG